MTQLFHITDRATWTAAQQAGEYRMSTRDVTLAEQGFIHCSLPHQLRGVAERLYGDADDLVVLVIDSAALSAPVRYQAPGPTDESFPHIHGPVPIDAVADVITVSRDAAGRLVLPYPGPAASEGIELSALTPGDWALWRRLRLAALAEAPHAFGSRLADWRGEGDREDRWRARLSIPGSYNVVAMLDGQPVGMASGVPAGEDGVLELISMWVAPVARGRGVGDRLVRAVEQWAGGTGAGVLRLAVVEGNDAADVLYRRNGFRRTGQLGDPMPDGVRRQYVMAKTLCTSIDDADGGAPAAG
jgi:uncharacterized protein (DUF952 family)/ribosomal protein S18 acetylase RimI-like enzyme